MGGATVYQTVTINLPVKGIVPPGKPTTALAGAISKSLSVTSLSGSYLNKVICSVSYELGEVIATVTVTVDLERKILSKISNVGLVKILKNY